MTTCTNMGKYFLSVYTIFLHIQLLWCHPQCLDFRPPFEVKSRLPFCSEYSSFSCCTAEMDRKIELDYKTIMSKTTNMVLDDTCSTFVKKLLCQECSPYAAHIFDAEASQVKKPIAGMCNSYCNDFYEKCQPIIQHMTDDANVLAKVNNKESFCTHNAVSDIDYCYPDLLTNSVLNEGIEREARTEEGCLCVEEFARNLSNPILAITPPDGTGRLFVAEQVGLVYIFYKNKTRLREPFLDLTHLVLTSSNTGDERGFLGMAFHPQFETNQKFYVFFSILLNGLHVGRVSEFTISSTDPDKVDDKSENVILEIRQPYWNHNGGMILFAPDSYLYIFLGDGGAGGDPHDYAQNKSSLLGKVVRVDIDNIPEGQSYGIPPDNPFINTPGARPEIYAYGIRNIWRCDVDEGDPETNYGFGRIICGDVGQNAYEEVDIIEKGGNYGWNAREGFECFNDDICGKIGPEVYPIHAYPHREGKSVTGGHVYRGCMNPNLQGKYIYGDFVYGKLWSLTENLETNRWTNKEIVMCESDVCFNGLTSKYENNILSFGEDDDGEIYMLTTSWASPTADKGRIYKLVDPRRRGDPAKCRTYTAEEPAIETTTTTTAFETTTTPAMLDTTADWHDAGTTSRTTTKSDQHPVELTTESSYPTDTANHSTSTSPRPTRDLEISISSRFHPDALLLLVAVTIGTRLLTC